MVRDEAVNREWWSRTQVATPSKTKKAANTKQMRRIQHG
jgi:hypothetical protein